MPDQILNPVPLDLSVFKLSETYPWGEGGWKISLERLLSSFNAITFITKPFLGELGTVPLSPSSSVTQLCTVF